MMHWGGFGWMFGGFFGLIILIGIILLVVWLARRGGSVQGGCCGGAPTEYSNRSALDIARERYARGEITKAEFDEIVRNLK